MFIFASLHVLDILDASLQVFLIIKTLQAVVPSTTL